MGLFFRATDEAYEEYVEISEALTQLTKDHGASICKGKDMLPCPDCGDLYKDRGIGARIYLLMEMISE